MLRVITQANPFKIEKTIHEYTLGYTIQELFDMEELGVDISSCHIMLNDTTIEKDFDVIKPFVDDTVYIKVLPEGEKFEVTSFGAMAGGLLTIGALALVGDDIRSLLGLIIAIAGWNGGRGNRSCPVV